jgi:hypothetical protein
LPKVSNNMKTHLSLILLAASLVLVGCSQGGPDVGKLQTTFASATGDLKTKVDRAVYSLKRDDPAAALPLLQAAFQSDQLTKDQKWALSDAITQTSVQLAKAKSN